VSEVLLLILSTRSRSCCNRNIKKGSREKRKQSTPQMGAAVLHAFSGLHGAGQA
jgi:uncharacterized protein YbbK (DUF523 family)